MTGRVIEFVRRPIGCISRAMTTLALVIMLVGLTPDMGVAVEPEEVLDDDGLESRALEISRHLRCLVCRNESIESSNAPLAADLRVLVRERLSEGDSDQQVLDYVVDRYGEFVLLKPLAEGSNLILWLAGPAALIIGGVIVGLTIRRNRQDRRLSSLTPEEVDRLDQLMGR